MAFKTSVSPIGDQDLRPPSVWPPAKSNEMTAEIRSNSDAFIITRNLHSWERRARPEKSTSLSERGDPSPDIRLFDRVRCQVPGTAVRLSGFCVAREAP